MKTLLMSLHNRYFDVKEYLSGNSLQQLEMNDWNSEKRLAIRIYNWA